MKRQISSIDYIAGTVRIKRGFAWLPKTVGDYRIWLRSYEVFYVYRIEVLPATINGEQKQLTKKYWDKVDERV